MSVKSKSKPAASPKSTIGDSAIVKNTDKVPTSNLKKYLVAETGRATGSFREEDTPIYLTKEQAKYLLSGGHINDPEKATKPAKD